MKLYRIKSIILISIVPFLTFILSISLIYSHVKLQSVLTDAIYQREMLDHDHLSRFSMSILHSAGKNNTDLLLYKTEVDTASSSLIKLKEKIKNIYNTESKLLNDPLMIVDKSLIPFDKFFFDSLYNDHKVEYDLLKQIIDTNSKLFVLKNNLNAAKSSRYHDLITIQKESRELSYEIINITAEYAILNKQRIGLFSEWLDRLHENDTMLVILIIAINLVVMLASLSLSLTILYRPVVALDDLAGKLLDKTVSIKNIHIPNFGENSFGKIGLAIRKILNYISDVDLVKGNIMSQVTHDLKSPLSTLKQGLEMLNDSSYGDLTSQQKEIINLMDSAYNNMNKLVNNLLDAARLEYDVISLKLSKFDIIQLFRDVFKEFTHQLREKKITIHFNRKNRNTLDVIADKERIRDVVRNLLSNAIKFTPEHGKIYIELDLKAGDVYFKIQDTGIGIPRDELTKIFEKMYRAKNSNQISVKGTGLGLFIVKNIISRHNGEIFVESQLGVGTAFKVYFPRLLTKPERSN